MTVGDRIKERRAALGMSRPTLAAASGVKYPTLAGLENGDQSGSTQLHQIAAALGCSPQWLATGRESSDGPTVASQSVGLDVDKLALVLEVVEGAIRDSRKQVPLRFKARMISRVYDSPSALTADSADIVRAALASLLEPEDA